MTHSSLSPHPAIAAGQLAVVTGGASGIGLASAAKLPGFGMRVCLVDRDSDALAAAQALLGAADERVVTRTVDRSDRAQIEALAAELGTVAVLMNNAAIGSGDDVLADPSAWEQVIGDLIENRPALSRWDPAYKSAFDAFMAG